MLPKVPSMRLPYTWSEAKIFRITPRFLRDNHILRNSPSCSKVPFISQPNHCRLSTRQPLTIVPLKLTRITEYPSETWLLWRISRIPQGSHHPHQLNPSLPHSPSSVRKRFKRQSTSRPHTLQRFSLLDLPFTTTNPRSQVYVESNSPLRRSASMTNPAIRASANP